MLVQVHSSPRAASWHLSEHQMPPGCTTACVKTLPQSILVLLMQLSGTGLLTRPSKVSSQLHLDPTSFFPIHPL